MVINLNVHGISIMVTGLLSATVHFYPQGMEHPLRGQPGPNPGGDPRTCQKSAGARFKRRGETVLCPAGTLGEHRKKRNRTVLGYSSTRTLTINQDETVVVGFKHCLFMFILLNISKWLFG